MTRRRLGTLVSLTEEQLARAERARDAGVTIVDLAPRFDVSVDHLRVLLRERRRQRMTETEHAGR